MQFIMSGSIYFLLPMPEEKTHLVLSRNQTQVLLLHKQSLWPLDHAALGQSSELKCFAKAYFAYICASLVDEETSSTIFADTLPLGPGPRGHSRVYFRPSCRPSSWSPQALNVLTFRSSSIGSSGEPSLPEPGPELDPAWVVQAETGAPERDHQGILAPVLSQGPLVW